MLATRGGIINNVLEWFGMEGLNWLGESNLALVSVCMVAVWKNVGYFLVIYYAGSMDIPVSLFEAAEVDGATGWQKLRYITILI